MKAKSNKNTLDGKDLMTTGIFTAVYLVIYIITSVVLGFIPILAVSMNFVSSFILGIPMMLYFSKIKKFGMVLITFLIHGVVMMLLGLGIYTFLAGIVISLLVELLLRFGGYKSINRAVLGFGLLCVGANANTLYWVTGASEIMEQTASSMGQEYLDAVLVYFNNDWGFPLIMLSAFVGGILGALLGKKVLKKHFVKSGLV